VGIGRADPWLRLKNPSSFTRRCSPCWKAGPLATWRRSRRTCAAASSSRKSRGPRHGRGHRESRGGPTNDAEGDTAITTQLVIVQRGREAVYAALGAAFARLEAPAGVRVIWDRRVARRRRRPSRVSTERRQGERRALLAESG